MWTEEIEPELIGHNMHFGIGGIVYLLFVMESITLWLVS